MESWDDFFGVSIINTFGILVWMFQYSLSDFDSWECFISLHVKESMHYYCYRHYSSTWNACFTYWSTWIQVSAFLLDTWQRAFAPVPSIREPGLNVCVFTSSRPALAHWRMGDLSISLPHLSPFQIKKK